ELAGAGEVACFREADGLVVDEVEALPEGGGGDAEVEGGRLGVVEAQLEQAELEVEVHAVGGEVYGFEERLAGVLQFARLDEGMGVDQVVLLRQRRPAGEQGEGGEGGDEGASDWFHAGSP